MSEPRIKILLHGPYQVSGAVPLKNESIAPDSAGNSVAWQTDTELTPPGEPYFLCRCGQSQNRPYCDGSHLKVDFQGEEVADKTATFEQLAQHYEGEALDLLDQYNLCAVARFCDVGDRIWKLVMESGDPEKKQLAIYEAQHCPAGRLVVYSKDGQPLEPPLEKEISVVEDIAMNCKGPLWIKGGITIEGADGQTYQARNRVTLCRCGHTHNAPFCDAEHTRSQNMKGLDYHKELNPDLQY